MSDILPDRFKADLSAYERATEAAERRPFDPWDDACIDEICDKHLAAPIRALLFTLAQIRHTERSFGMRDHGKVKAYDALRNELDALEEACKAAWADL